MKLQTLDDVTLRADISPSFDFFEARLHSDMPEVHDRCERLDVFLVGPGCIEELEISRAGEG